MSDRKDIVTQDDYSPERIAQKTMPVVTPLVDIYENDDEILLFVDMPGVRKDDMTIHLENGGLRLVGVRKLMRTAAARFEEFGDVEFGRSFAVPQGIDSDKVNAELTGGVLHLHLPKSDTVKPRRIEIREG